MRVLCMIFCAVPCCLRFRRRADIFKYDPDFTQNEEKYREIKAEILGEGDSSEGSGSEDSEDSEDETRERSFLFAPYPCSSHVTAVADKEGIEDKTGTNLVNLRRTIYLTIMNSASCFCL